MIVKRPMNYIPKNKNRQLHIYLPDDYETSGKRYPVMYFFDGHNLFFNEDATFGKSWGLKEYLDGFDPQLILVGMECGHEGDERLAEYCPYHMYASFCGDLKGIGRQTMKWIVEDVKPMIDATYRTLKDREFTGIGGSSMGGLMALYAGICFHDTFSKLACVSSSIAPCMDQLIDDISRQDDLRDTRFYLSWGETESRWHGETGDMWTLPSSLDNQKIAACLEAKGACTKLYLQPSGRHCEADWEKQNPIYMPYLWQS